MFHTLLLYGICLARKNKNDSCRLVYICIYIFTYTWAIYIYTYMIPFTTRCTIAFIECPTSAVQLWCTPWGNEAWFWCRFFWTKKLLTSNVKTCVSLAFGFFSKPVTKGSSGESGESFLIETWWKHGNSTKFPPPKLIIFQDRKMLCHTFFTETKHGGSYGSVPHEVFGRWNAVAHSAAKPALLPGEWNVSATIFYGWNMVMIWPSNFTGLP